MGFAGRPEHRLDIADGEILHALSLDTEGDLSRQ